jgi:hypothetical protein
MTVLDPPTRSAAEASTDVPTRTAFRTCPLCEAGCGLEVTVARDDDGTCTLTGLVVDQAQLHGILARLRDIGVPLVSLRSLDGDGEGGA